MKWDEELAARFVPAAVALFDNGASNKLIIAEAFSLADAFIEECAARDAEDRLPYVVIDANGFL